MGVILTKGNGFRHHLYIVLLTTTLIFVPQILKFWHD